MRRQERSKNYCHSGSNVDPLDNRRRSQKSSEDCDGGSARRKLSSALQKKYQEKSRDRGSSCIYSKRLPKTHKDNSDANCRGRPRNNEHDADHRKVSSIMLQDKSPSKWTRKDYPTTMVAVPHDRSRVLQRHTVGACRRSVSSDGYKEGLLQSILR